MSIQRELPRQATVVTALGVTQILAWGSSYYLLAVIAKPVTHDTGWPLHWILGGLSLGLLAAGLTSPRISRIIQSRGGRPVLSASSISIGCGLATLALADQLAVYLAGWIVIGLGMGAGLYDAAFATLGRLYGGQARGAISTLTLFGGFASTVCWPLSAVLVETVGWRGACIFYAGLHFAICLPLHLFLLPQSDTALAPASRATNGRDGMIPQGSRRTFALIAAAITLSAIVASSMSTHLINILQAQGVSLAAAVALGTILGPAQVGARLIERAFGRYYHPLWTMFASVALMAAGCALLAAGAAMPGLALAVYGAGNGIGSIARGAVPLEMFGPHNYAPIMGRIAFFALIAQALAPSIAAVVFEQIGAASLLVGLTAVTALASVLVGWVGLDALRVIR